MSQHVQECVLVVLAGNMTIGLNGSDTGGWWMAVVEKVKKLNKESVRGWLDSRKGWKRRSNKLTKEFIFTRFRDSIVFVNRVATIADSCQHHPDMEVCGGTVTLSLSTEEVGGITEKDLGLAEQIDFATSWQGSR